MILPKKWCPVCGKKALQCLDTKVGPEMRLLTWFHATKDNLILTCKALVKPDSVKAYSILQK